jgi:hypothetical protein
MRKDRIGAVVRPRYYCTRKTPTSGVEELSEKAQHSPLESARWTTILARHIFGNDSNKPLKAFIMDHDSKLAF